MSERDKTPDKEPELLLPKEARSLRKNIVDLTKQFGSERVNHDGLTATFQLDSQRILTLRNITKNGEYTKGTYVVLWQTVQEYPDGSSMQLCREYQFYGRAADPYILERAVHLDADEEEVAFEPERDTSMHVMLWNRYLAKRKAELEQFMEQFDDHSFYDYQAGELEGLLGTVNAANLVACEDETAEGI